MYKVNYYTLARCDDGSVGNVRQYSDIWYTEQKIEVIPKELQRVINLKKGADKYVPVITNIESIDGHL